MNSFEYANAKTVPQAVQLGSGAKTAQQGAEVRFIAGGTTLVDLMKLGVETPKTVVNINRLDLGRIETLPDGSLKIGATVRNSDLANDAGVKERYAVLSEALLAGASGQLRNMASTSGNLLQRTRCPYFRDTAFTECNKRTPGSGCGALLGHNRTNAVLGGSDACIATHASDMAVAMAALEAKIQVQGAKGERVIPIGEFYRLPGTTPHLENALEPGDLITHVTLAAPREGSRSHYLKLRDRASYEFALASAAVVVKVEGGHITHARVALGGVGTRPWRSPGAEAALHGKPANEATFMRAAMAALHGAKAHSENGYKMELAKRCVVRALATATA